jgi:hypothetical protein
MSCVPQMKRTEAKIIVGAQVQQGPVGTCHPHPGALRRDDQPFAFGQPLGLDAAKTVPQVDQEGGRI